MNRTEYVSLIKLKVIKAAESIINNTINIIEGTRIIVDGWKELKLAENDLFYYFKAIDSETDDYPVGDTRALWNPEALKEADLEIGKYITKFKPQLDEKCRKLILAINECKE